MNDAQKKFNPKCINNAWSLIFFAIQNRWALHENFSYTILRWKVHEKFSIVMPKSKFGQKGILKSKNLKKNYVIFYKLIDLDETLKSICFLSDKNSKFFGKKWIFVRKT